MTVTMMITNQAIDAYDDWTKTESETEIMMSDDETSHNSSSLVVTANKIYTYPEISSNCNDCEILPQTSDVSEVTSELPTDTSIVIQDLQVNPSPRRSVTFSDIIIREYPYEIGDNPGSRTGPALTLKWNYVNERTFTVDGYEKSRPYDYRRLFHEMLIPPSVRMEILRTAGYSRAEIIKGTRIVNIVRSQRRRTLDMLKSSDIEELSEKIARKTINILTLGTRKRKEKKYISDALSFQRSN